MSKYYTETIPTDLALALKQGGPVETEGKNVWCPSPSMANSFNNQKENPEEYQQFLAMKEKYEI